jgi:hypothetical protein
MHPQSIYPQLPHFRNHGLAIPFHFISKEIFEECFSPRLSSKFPSPRRDGALKKGEREKVLKKRKEKKRKKKKSSKSLFK